MERTVMANSKYIFLMYIYVVYIYIYRVDNEKQLIIEFCSTSTKRTRTTLRLRNSYTAPFPHHTSNG